MRAAEAYTSIRRHAERVSEELDEVTSPGGIPKVELSDEDSMVVAVAEVIAVAGAGTK